MTGNRKVENIAAANEQIAGTKGIVKQSLFLI